MSPAPVVSPFALERYDEFKHLQGFDESDATGWHLLVLMEAIARMGFQEAEEWARDTDDHKGWTILLDIDRVPSKGLGFLGMFVGVTLQANLDDASQRLRIQETDGQRRGSPDSIRGAVRQHLTGAKTVALRERVDGNAYKLSVISYASQTPDPAAALASLIAQKPAGIILTYSVFTGQDWQQVLTNNVTWQGVKDNFATWQAVKDAQPPLG